MSISGEKNRLKYLTALHYFPKFGPVRLNKITASFALMEEAFYAGADRLIRAGIEEPIAREFVEARKEIDPETLFEKIEKNGIKIIEAGGEEYPRRLKEIPSPPPLLYCLGEVKNETDDFSVAVVGTRKYTAYGEAAAQKIAGGLAAAGIPVVSGLALGIDAIAHRAALDRNSRTVAVLGSGVDYGSIYPAANASLARAIAESDGALISEFPPGAQALKHHFPQRNRIIAGLSRGVTVIECREKSGALITADFALDFNREVFAVPGGIFSPTSAGPNSLIKKGAHPVADAKEIIEILGLENITTAVETRKILPETPEEKIIIECLEAGAKSADEIIRRTGLKAATIGGALSVMEMKGLIKPGAGGEYLVV